MREIKFRAQTYDGDTRNGWVYSTDHGLSDFWYGIEDGRYDEETVCQYTGLKDRNGTEIYEHDLILVGMGEHKRVFGVMFDKGNYYGNPYPNLTYPWSGSFIESLGKLDLHFVEVIGNIYENPELLKERR